MGWELKTTPVGMAATKELAKEFVEMTPAPHDRPLKQRRLEVYEKLVEARQFRPVTWAKAWCVETGDWYRVNGKHTSVLLYERLKTIPKGFHIIVETYECDTLEDVAKLYATFDSKMQSRAATDIYLSFAATCPELADIPSQTLTGLVSGIGYHLHGEDYWYLQPAERAELLLDNVPFCMWYKEMYVGEQDNIKHVRSLMRMAPVAAMMGCWLKKPNEATKFWTLVRDESGTDPKNPDRRLAKYLSTTKIKGLSTGRNMTVNPREMMVKCIHAWNAWRRGEKTNLNYYKDKEVPGFA